jgi:7,8-dihydroneopterin 2',3'-cyclic phosphate phosphodiesterase
MYVIEFVEKLKSVAENIKDDKIREVTLSILNNPILSFTDVKPLIKFEESPAAPRKHHMFTGGLFVHTYSVVKIALALCDIFEEVYNISVNRDLVIAAAILHDIYKYYQYVKDEKEGGYKARDDWYLSHDYAIVAELAFRSVKDDLIRVVSEVHGIAPIKTYEGLIVHLADTIDAKLGEYIQTNALNILKQLEQQISKPYEVLDEVVKLEGVKVLGLLSKNVEEFVKVIQKFVQRVYT